MSALSSLSSLTNNASSSTLPTDTSSKDYKQQFLKLLFAQLKNQDPTQPFDSQKMLTQQAEFESLEQMQNLNTNFVALMAMQNTSQAASMLGKTVTGTVGTSPQTGIVQGVKFIDGQPVLQVKVSPTSTVEMALSNVSEITL